MIEGEGMGSSFEDELLIKIEKLPDIHFLTQYRADESNYGFYEPNIIYSCHKLNEVYLTYAIARMNLLFIANEDYGDFAFDETSKKFLKPQFLMNSLHHYNILIDLSWQLLWFYIRVDLNHRLPTAEVYENEAKFCNFEVLSYYLTLGKKYKLRDYFLRGFFERTATKNIREKWNYSKHRGIFHFGGMGMNSTQMNIILNGNVAPVVSKKELKIEDTALQLLEFDYLFYQYLQDLIRIIFPANFLSNKNFMTSIIQYEMRWRDEISKHQKGLL